MPLEPQSNHPRNMISRNEYDSAALEQINDNPDFSEHAVRLHLLCYSVIDYIGNTKLSWFTRVRIQHGYFGLLQIDLLNSIHKDDPFDLRNVDENDFEALQGLVRYQLQWFLDNPFHGAYEDSRFILQELSFTEREAVKRLDDNSNDSGLSNCSFELDHKALSTNGYRRLLESYLAEFYRRLPYLSPGKRVVELMAQEASGSGSLINFTSGCGEILVELSKNAHPPDHVDGYISVEARPVYFLEGLLCELNLWAVSDRLGESDVYSEGGDIFKVVTDTDSTKYDIAIGFASPADSFDSEYLRNQRFLNQLLPAGADYPEAYLTALIESVEPSQGKVVVAVPISMLHSNSAYQTRSRLIANRQITKVIEVEDSECGPIAVLSLGGFEREDSELVELVKGTQSVKIPFHRVQDGNDDLDLRPSRYLRSVEYRFREVLEIFDDTRMPERLRPRFVALLEKLDSDWNPGDLVEIRKVVEEFLKTIRHKNPALLPDDVFNLREGRIPACVLFLGGRPDFRFPRRWQKARPVIPASVFHALSLCVDFGNQGAHGNGSNLDGSAFNASLYSMIVALKWLSGNLDRL